MATRAVITLPTALKAGEAFEVRATVAHAMETGYRTGDDGARLPPARGIVRCLGNRRFRPVRKSVDGRRRTNLEC